MSGDDWIIDTPPGLDTVPDFSRPPLARLLSEARARQGLTRRELAAAVGCPREMITAWERGYFSPRAEYIRPLVKVLGLGMRHLLAAAEQQARGGTNGRPR